MSDLLGILFFVLLIAGVIVGIKVLGNPRKRTEEEFERRAEEGPGTLNAGMMALDKLLNPEAAKAAEVKMDLKGGRYNKKKREGKGNGNLPEEETGED